MLDTECKVNCKLCSYNVLFSLLFIHLLNFWMRCLNVFEDKIQYTQNNNNTKHVREKSYCFTFWSCVFRCPIVQIYRMFWSL